jgi:transcriptional regulator with XRE-family HTH domain
MDQGRIVARQIGQRIRTARTERRLTLNDLGKEIGLSAAFLSRIERGEAATSISNLIAITGCLNLSFRDLFDDVPSLPGPKGYTVSRRSVRETEPPVKASGYEYHWLAGRLPDPNLNAFLLSFPVSSNTDVKLLTHSGEEILYVLEGRIEFQIGEDSLVLEAGDSVHLMGSKPHMGRNVGANTARMLMVVTPFNIEPH